MKYLFAFLLLVLFHNGFSQIKHLSKVDQYAASVGYYSIDSLHDKLALKSYSDSEKVRSFFYWMTQHISYDIAEYRKQGYVAPIHWESDDSLEWEARHNNDYAGYVLKRKKGVCEGYATLFKVLCDRSKINCMVVYGCVKTDGDDIGAPFDENHAWNAVQLNGKWFLMDVCWASGHSNDIVTKYTKELDEAYYLASPDRLIYNHYPSDTRWALLEKVPSRTEFENFPIVYLGKNRIKFDTASRNGIVSGRIGDTLNIELELLSEAPPKKGYVSGIYEFDEKGRMLPHSQKLIAPTFHKDGSKLRYNYRVGSKKVSWLYLSHGSEYLAVYKLQIK